MPTDDLVARARELGAPMNAPEAGIARRSALLLLLADRVEELDGLIKDLEWSHSSLRENGWFEPACPVCGVLREPGHHLPGCRLARALGKGEKSDG